MEFHANSGKNVRIETSTGTYDRHAIHTHFVRIGEDYIALMEQYVKPLYEEGDILSMGEKVVALCQKRVVYKKDMKVSWLAKFLSRFAMHSDAGIGVDSPYKMQFAINHCGVWKILYAAFRSALGKLVGKHGIFYDIAGIEVEGLDGFYDHVFEEYGNYGIRIPENSTGVCNEIFEKTGIRSMIVDANDLTITILGHADALNMTEAELTELIQDNPAGQSDELTPFILIRPVKEAADAAEQTAEASGE